MSEFDCIRCSAITMPQPKSAMKCGSITVYNERSFSWLQRKMWKILLGFEVWNMEETNGKT